MRVLTIILCLIVPSFGATSDNGTSDDYEDTKLNTNYLCPIYIKDISNKTIVDITQTCKGRSCVGKCCPDKQMFFYNETFECRSISDLEREYDTKIIIDYSEIEVYNEDIKREVIKTSKTLDDFTFLFVNWIGDGSCSFDMSLFLESKTTEYFFLENGTYITRQPNTWTLWNAEYKLGGWCLDHQVTLDGDKISLPEIVRIVASDAEQDDENEISIIYRACGMLVSSFFMLLVMVIYSVLPQLRNNMAGYMMIAFTGTNATAFIIKAWHLLASSQGSMTSTTCAVLGVSFYYTVMASFFWMNVLSFDMFWTLRGLVKAQGIHRRGKKVKFCIYCAYAYGLALLLTTFLVVIDLVDLTHVPSFVQPHILKNAEFCSFADKERQLYLNIPILIISCTNVVLFFMTAFNIWRINNGINKHSVGESKKTKELNRFALYLKLSVVMGISWILEVLSSLVNPTSSGWYIADAYNTLTGLFIFILFVCKRTVFVALCRRMNIDNDFVRRMSAIQTDSTRNRSAKSSMSRKISVNTSTATGSSYDGEQTVPLKGTEC